MEAERERLSVEELANCVTHGVGLGLSLVGLAALLMLAATRGGTLHLVSGGVYGASLVALYTASTLYHAARHPRSKDALRIFDKCCIYLLIAAPTRPSRSSRCAAAGAGAVHHSCGSRLDRHPRDDFSANATSRRHSAPTF